MLYDILQSIAAAFRPGSFTPQDRWVELEGAAAVDKHREVVNEVEIAHLQARIVANGGTVRYVEPAEHAADLEARRRFK